jgi:hypothetical protein
MQVAFKEPNTRTSNHSRTIFIRFNPLSQITRHIDLTEIAPTFLPYHSKMAARLLVPIALASIALAGELQSCPSDLPLSCQNTTVVEDTCCFITAGQLLLTQFWDTDPATGPSGE